MNRAGVRVCNHPPVCAFPPRQQGWKRHCPIGSPALYELFTSCILHNSSQAGNSHCVHRTTELALTHAKRVSTSKQQGLPLGLLHAQDLLSQEKGRAFISRLVSLTLCLQYLLLNKVPAQHQHLVFQVLGAVSAR